jgi:putative (di)nucleoside polyphosphate hydrolase
VNLPAQYFRAGAGAVVVNDSGFVFAIERKAAPGAWQLPQGGLDAGEEPLQAVYRELFEETGMAAEDLELLGHFPWPLAYDLPAEYRKPKTGRGQAQYWFLLRFRGDEKKIDLTKEGEASCWNWMPFESLLECVAPFRKPVYEKLHEFFKEPLTAR